MISLISNAMYRCFTFFLRLLESGSSMLFWKQVSPDWLMC